jgi:hypothetical protein
MTAAKKKYLKPSKKFESRIELSGSFRKLPAGINLGNTSFNQVIEVMVKVRRKNPIRNYIRGITNDRDTDGKAHVDFPASSPYAIACSGHSFINKFRNRLE